MIAVVAVFVYLFIFFFLGGGGRGIMYDTRIIIRIPQKNISN